MHLSSKLLNFDDYLIVKKWKRDDFKTVVLYLKYFDRLFFHKTTIIAI